MVRRPLAGLALIAGVALCGCRSSTVSVAFTPRIGQRSTYRYVIATTVTRTVEGGHPTTTHLATVLTAQERVLTVNGDGARVRVVLARDGGTTRTATVVLSRAGSLEGVSSVEGLDDATLGLDQDPALGPTRITAPPDHPLAPGDRWTIRQGASHGGGRLDHLGVVDGQEVAAVATHLSTDLAQRGRAESSATLLTGSATSDATTTYDLHGGAIRRSRSHTHGQVQATLAPPAGSTAQPVQATITYDVTVGVTRTS